MDILVSDDEFISRSLLAHMLSELGHEVIEAENGRRAWDEFQRRDIGLVITDWHMPEINGPELCRKIRSKERGGYSYIIALTANDRRTDRVDVFAAGADDCMSKPFDPEELKARVMAGMRVMNAFKRLEAIQERMLHSEKMAAIGQLTAGVAHEINNPTGYVCNNLKTLSDYQKDIGRLLGKYHEMLGSMAPPGDCVQAGAKLKADIEAIKSLEKEIDIEFILEDIVDLIGDCREGADRIKHIVTDLKDFAHPGDGTLQRTDINRCLDATLNVASNEIKYRAAVHKHYGADLWVDACPQQLSQVFMNILVNAAQSMASRGEIHIETRPSGNMVEVQIRDTGCGIAEKDLSKLFDPFFTTKDVGKGTGLGLNIARRIIQEHHGHIAVESVPGRGTTFIVRLPHADPLTCADSDPPHPGGALQHTPSLAVGGPGFTQQPCRLRHPRER